LSGQFSQRSLFAAVDANLCAIFASRTHRNVMKQSKYNQIIELIIINCGLTILIVSLLSLCRLRNTAQFRSGTVDRWKWPVFLQNESDNQWRNYSFEPGVRKVSLKGGYRSP